MKQYITKEQMIAVIKKHGFITKPSFANAIFVKHDKLQEMFSDAISQWIKSQSGELPEPEVHTWTWDNDTQDYRPGDKSYSKDQLREAIAAAKGKMGEQEPFAWFYNQDPWGANETEVVFDDPQDKRYKPLYTNPLPSQQAAQPTLSQKMAAAGFTRHKTLGELQREEDAQPAPQAQPVEYVCKVCGNSPDDQGWLRHGKGCYMQSSDGGGMEFIESSVTPTPAQDGVTWTQNVFQGNPPKRYKSWYDFINSQIKTGVTIRSSDPQDWTPQQALPAPVVPQWQPIETKPEEGEFLVYMPSAKRMKVQAAWVTKNGVFIIGGKFAFDEEEPTLWMPIPPILLSAAPKQEEL